jgi:hypothetical protein
VSSYKKLALRLKKSLYGLKQTGRLWSQLLHAKLMELGFTRCITNMCLYYKRDGDDMTIVGVYVDDLLATASKPDLVEDFFVAMRILPIKDLGKVSKFLGMSVHLDEADGYSLDQQAAIKEQLEQFGLTGGVVTVDGAIVHWIARSRRACRCPRWRPNSRRPPTSDASCSDYVS